MKKIVVCVLVFAASAFAELDKGQVEVFKKESAALRASIDEIVNSTVAGRGMTEAAKATYLEGYGIVITLEASLEPTRSPFSSPKTPREIRDTVEERRRIIETRIEALLKQRVPALQSLAATDSLSVVLHLFNSNPADVPDLPSQVVFTAKKQDPSKVVRRQL
jgi:hypothetical protein